MLKCVSVMKLQPHVVPEVTGKIERQSIEFKNIKAEFMNYDFADNLQTAAEITRIDMLIQNNYYTDI